MHLGVAFLLLVSIFKVGRPNSVLHRLSNQTLTTSVKLYDFNIY